MNHRPLRQPGVSQPRHARRRGALLSAELILVMPVLVGFFLAMVQFGLLLLSHQQLQNGCRLACRAATLPGFENSEIETTVRHSLAWIRLADHFEIETFSPGQFTGDPVELSIRVPMSEAAPDMLGFLGISMRGKMLHARTVMRRE